MMMMMQEHDLPQQRILFFPKNGGLPNFQRFQPNAVEQPFVKMFSCPHPRDSSYLFQLGISHPEKGETHPVLWEIRALDNNSFSPTWLIQNTVQHSNPVYFITRFNPLYLYLPYLTLHQDELLPINDVLRSISYPSAPGLPVCAFEQICTVKDNDRIQIHEAKTLRWLRQTVDRVQVKIAQKKKTTMSESDLQSALHCIGEYLPPVWYEKLCQDLNVPPLSVFQKTKIVTKNIHQVKENLNRFNHRQDSSTPETKSCTKRKTPDSRKPSRAKKKGPNVPMKSLTSFFHKKTNP